MTVRNLDKLFSPRSVALIGASRTEGSVGYVLARNLLHDGFSGTVMPVNPHAKSIASVAAYPDVESLPETPDLAVICTPPDTVPEIIASLGERGTKAAVVITAGFGELGDEGKALQGRMLEAARPHLLRIVGPNVVGILVPSIGLNASFCHIGATPGDIAFVSQSGAVITTIVDWASARGIGFSHVVSLGDMADVDFGDMLDYLGRDPATRSILLYVENITHARKFMSAARAASRLKPVVVIKAGRHEAAARAAASHTGALAGSDEVYDAAFRRAGMLRVFDLEELFDAAETLAAGIDAVGDRLAIVTNGGGVGVLATDGLIDEGGRLAEFSDETIKKLDGVLPPTWSRGNPVDIIGDAPGSRYRAALEAVLADRNIDAVLVLNCPTAIADSVDAARAVIEVADERPRSSRRVPVLTSWLGEGAAINARRLFAEHRIPTYGTPGKAARAFMHLVRHRRGQDQLMETPPAFDVAFNVDTTRAKKTIDDAVADGREWLNEAEAKVLLAAYDIPVIETVTAAGIEEAASAAAELGGPVALKILSPEITHKSDAGGVALNLVGRDAVREAATAMLERIAAAQPDATIAGFTVQRMADMRDAQELIIGINDDETFGPVVLFGHGGTAVEVLKDRAIALPPLNLPLARAQIARTRVARLLAGYRDRAPADIDAIAMTLIKVARIACDLAAVRELDINPLIAGPQGVLALDARVRIAPVAADAPAHQRLAIRPYPHDLEREIETRSGRRFRLRPVRPEDEPAIQALVGRLDPEDARMRFLGPLRRLPHKLAARLTQIDYDREMAFVALPTEQSADGAPDEVAGVVRISADPDNERAEYAVLVDTSLKGQGLGYTLMQEIIAYARAQGTGELFGHVLHENRAMLQMARELGFSVHPLQEDPGIMEAVLDLSKAEADLKAGG